MKGGRKEGRKEGRTFLPAEKMFLGQERKLGFPLSRQVLLISEHFFHHPVVFCTVLQIKSKPKHVSYFIRPPYSLPTSLHYSLSSHFTPFHLHHQ